MKLAQILISGLLAASMAGTVGCGTRGTIVLPEPPGTEVPSEIGNVTVTVIDQASEPVEGATVTLTNAEGGEVAPAATSDASGKALFTKVALGTGYTVTAEHGGVTGTQKGLGVDSEQPLLVSIMLVAADGALGTIGGGVVDGLTGRPVDGATVSVLGVQTTVTAGADGQYLLKGVPSGNPTLVAIAKGYREARQSVNLRAGKLERAEIKLYPAGNGARVGNTLVSTQRGLLEFDRGGRLAWSNKQGAFQARALENGNMLVTDGSGVAEINSGNTAMWRYKPLLVGRLASPQGISRTASGNTLVADTNNHRVIEVSMGHKVERKLPARLNGPRSAERIESTHTTLITDTGNHRVIEIDESGQIVWSVGDGTPGIVNHPTYATRLPNGNTLVTDTGNHRVMEVNKDRRLVWMYGGDGNRATCYLPGSAIRLGNGNTLIADTGNDRVIEVDKAGKVVVQLGNIEQPLFADRI